MTGPLLEFRNVVKRFGGVTALDDFSMTLDQSEILGLIGPNGSGKTTSFNVLTGIYGPTGGQVFFEGQEITGADPRAVYEAGIVRTFQRSRLCLPLSIYDNIMIGDTSRLVRGLWSNLISRRGLQEQLDMTRRQARDLVATFSGHLADRMDQPVGTLPMIERRRIEICRALISGPRLLLLDEPSAGMTHDETHQLMDDILDVRARGEGLSIIIVEHEMGVIERITDRCIVLSYGRKIAEGTYAEVAADSEVQNAYLGAD
ncbi:MAG: ABC transporter ATP-binding protein [Thioclava marina]|jgi:amino acid/amide ABC transporter ATP-binding protein 1, HAAT family (TC 3.A.1.4.-)|uniref:ABC transporter ATP-binding protein n=1 Tax=Thioclava marina TaxID=1915077 RepID=A0ABX3MQ01_9RHOB|nr:MULTISPECIES: ABC transporter ATP-binding protein [Thioclava]TNE92975.1 MAG: ABC transporter ATP-binding protein [Paracoccaceae bacterium]MBC7145448.1 ABC transporter ATP-binding protein [Thioclava marina]MBD3802433.1 ABC transporter ATP-binding protein [Thioclava sp.]OOY13617.1 ABC transporter ATP-binding protein [Thioclava marina]OOY29327.1 ABC transporter ATP-binding protein [Thioclava sp. L04-15]